MKIILIIPILIFSLCFSYAQEVIQDDNFEFEPHRTAKIAVFEIIKYAGIESDLMVHQEDVKTAVAYISDGKRHIGYNPDFFVEILEKTGTQWSIISILAHEIGHHLCGHTLTPKQIDITKELQVDKFSGFILNKMGATLEESKIAMLTIGSDLDTLNHPPKQVRLDAIEVGWNEAESQKSMAPYTLVAEKEDSSTIKFIYSCTIQGDEHLYFVDSKDRILWFNNKGEPVLKGFKLPSEDKSYQWVYAYEEKRYFVDGAGDIWSRNLSGAVFKIGEVNRLK
jgi:hypothetical protein